MYLVKPTQWHLFNLVRIGKVQESQGRICPFLSSSLDKLSEDTLDKVKVINEFYESKEGVVSEANQPYVDILPKLASYPAGTLGHALGEFYARSQFPQLGKIGAFPAKYIMIHDAHHILIDVKPDLQGEIDVCAFEGGLAGGKSSTSLLPLLAQVKAFEYDFDINRVAVAWEIGCQAKPGLLEDWDILNYLWYPLDTLRREYCINHERLLSLR